MSEDTDISGVLREVLSEVKDGWRGEPAISELQFEVAPDHSDNPAVFVLVVIPDDADGTGPDSAALDAISRLIKERVHSKNTDRWVYVRFAHTSDLNGDPLDGEG